MRPIGCRSQRRCEAGGLLLAGLWLAACQHSGPPLVTPLQVVADAYADPAPPAVSLPLPPSPADSRSHDEPDFIRRPAAPTYRLIVLHIEIPRNEAVAVESVWRYVREDVTSAARQLALKSNGFRAGVGHADNWSAVKAAFERAEGVRANMPQPVRVPSDYPLALQMDDGLADQTLFYMGPDGIVSGHTWPSSRNVLRVSYGPDPADPAGVRIVLVPEVRQPRLGLDLVPTPAGVRQVPRSRTHPFAAAAFEVCLAPGEFLLMGPSTDDLAYGLLGSAFLSRERGGVRYDSYVVMRPELEHGNESG